MGHATSRHAWVLTAVPIFGLVMGLQLSISNATYADWLSYVRGVDALLAGRSPYAAMQLAGPYLLSEAAEGRGYVYPPSAAVVMAPVIRPFELWAAASVTTFAIGLLAVLWRHDAFRPLPTIAVLCVSAFSSPLWDGIVSGAASPMLAGMLGLVYAGAPLVGVSAAVKLFPITWLLLDTSRRSLALSSITLVGAVAAAIAFSGIEPWIEYVPAYLNMRPDCNMFSSVVCSGVPSAIVYVLGAGTLVAGLMLRGAWLILALGLATLIVAPQLPLHYAVLLGPGIVSVACVVSGRLRDGQRPRVRSPEANAD